MSQGPFSGKRSALLRQELVLNRYFQGFPDGEVWDERAILKRGEQLADLAVQVWPR